MRKNLRSEFRYKKKGLKAWIRFDDGFSVRPCLLVDMSVGGVRLVVDEPYAVADQFSLMLTRNAVPGRRCRVRRRHGQEIAAEFLGARNAA